MSSKIFHYPLTIKEVYLDAYGHVNNAVYFTLYEDARWQLLNDNNYSLAKIKESKLGPIILEITIRYMRELNARDEIIIESQLQSYQKTIGKMKQRMLRGDVVCSTAEITFGLFSLAERKLVTPTKEWLEAVGFEE